MVCLKLLALLLCATLLTLAYGNESDSSNADLSRDGSSYGYNARYPNGRLSSRYNYRNPQYNYGYKFNRRDYADDRNYGYSYDVKPTHLNSYWPGHQRGYYSYSVTEQRRNPGGYNGHYSRGYDRSYAGGHYDRNYAGGYDRSYAGSYGRNYAGRDGRGWNYNRMHRMSNNMGVYAGQGNSGRQG